MGRLAHQNIVAIYDIGEHTASDGTRQPFLVQELVAGGDVEGLLADTEGGLDLPRDLCPLSAGVTSPAASPILGSIRARRRRP